ncbi:TPA: adsorption protein, partial [Vibrio vulnificus]|nr:adsorption protein [Vibrio vulnificus]
MRYFSFLLFFFSLFANAAVFKLPSGILPDKTFVTVEAAAQAYISFTGFGSCRIDTNGFTKYEIGEIYQASFDLVITKWLDENCKAFSRKSISSIALVVLDECPDGSQPNLETGECEKNRCTALKGETGKIGWNSAWWGKASPSSYVCSPKGEGCVSLVGQSYCIDIDPDALASDPGLYDCDAYYIVQESECDIPDGASFCTDDTCTEFMPEPQGPTNPNPDPDPDPDPEPEPDPEHKPTDPTDPIPDPSPLPDESTGQVPTNP